MRKARSLILTGFLIVGYVTSSLAIDKEAGTSGAAFLRINPDARIKAMGSAGSALCEGIGFVWANPAAIASPPRREIDLTYLSYIQGISLGRLSYAQELGPGKLGANIVYLKYNDIPYYDEDSGQKPILKGNYQSNNLVVILSYGWKMTDLSLGTNIKYIRAKIEEEDADCLGVDLGLIYETAYEDLCFSAVVQNLGWELKFKEEGDSLPLNFKFGTSYKCFLVNRPLTLALDINLGGGNKVNYSFGTEYSINEMLTLRTGYHETEEGEGTEIACGIGFKLGNFNLDYAWQPYGNLGQAHWFSFKVNF